MTPASPKQRQLALFAWVAVCVIWGTTYLGIRISLESIPPALMGGLRWTAAGALLAVYVRARGGALPPPSRWGSITLLAFLLLGLGNGGVVVAEQWVPSGLTAVLVASSPFWMAGVEACLKDGERLTRTMLGGSPHRLCRDSRPRLAGPDAGVVCGPRVPRGRHLAADRVARMVARLIGTRAGTLARITCWRRRRIRCWRVV